MNTRKRRAFENTRRAVTAASTTKTCSSTNRHPMTIPTRLQSAACIPNSRQRCSSSCDIWLFIRWTCCLFQTSFRVFMKAVRSPHATLLIPWRAMIMEWHGQQKACKNECPFFLMSKQEKHIITYNKNARIATKSCDATSRRRST